MAALTAPFANTVATEHSLPLEDSDQALTATVDVLVDELFGQILHLQRRRCR